MAPTLHCRDLKPGDVMVQENLGNLAGSVISTGQKAVGQTHANFVHAGIMFDSTFIIEALGAGISANDLRIGTRNCGYAVFRPRNKQLGTIAANFAKLLYDSHGARHKLSYSVLGAIGSLGANKSAKSTSDLDKMVDKIFGARGKNFFCSQFVVATYQIAGGQIGMPPTSIFAIDDATASPARLATILQTSHAFESVGVMVPNQR